MGREDGEMYPQPDDGRKDMACRAERTQMLWDGLHGQLHVLIAYLQRMQDFMTCMSLAEFSPLPLFPSHMHSPLHILCPTNS